MRHPPLFALALSTKQNATAITFIKSKYIIYNITYKGNDFKSEVFANIQGVRFAIEAKVTRE